MDLKLRTLAGILAIACVCAPLSHAQKPTKEILRMIVFNDVDMAALLASLAGDYENTIGFEAAPDTPKPKISIKLRDVTFPQILDGIVKAEPKYRWRENDGSIEVFPLNAGSSLLDTPVQRFQVKDVNRAAAVYNLLVLPEVRAIASSMNLKLRPPDGPSERIKDEKLSFDLSGVTLRQALNRIATDSGGRFWVFRRYSDGTFEVTVR
jgi:hypothetical protein